MEWILDSPRLCNSGRTSPAWTGEDQGASTAPAALLLPETPAALRTPCPPWPSKQRCENQNKEFWLGGELTAGSATNKQTNEILFYSYCKQPGRNEDILKRYLYHTLGYQTLPQGNGRRKKLTLMPVKGEPVSPGRDFTV